MIYRDTTQKPFVLIDIDKYTGIDILDAVTLVDEARIYRPSVRWTDGEELFTGDIANGDGVGIAMLPDEQKCPNSIWAVKQAGRLRSPGAYIITTKFEDVPSFGTESLSESLQATVRNVSDGGGKRFVLITSRGKMEQNHPGLFGMLEALNPGIPHFEEVSTNRASLDKKDFESIIKTSAPPDFLEPWDWADNQDYIEWIDRLTPGEMQEVIGRRMYEPALERVRNAIGTTQKLFCDRDHAAEMLLACGIARINLVYLGPPGTAKSELVRTFAATLGIRPESRPIHEEYKAASEAKKHQGDGRSNRRLFEYLLTRYTTPEELFGSADVDLLLNKGVHGRRTDGMLPQAEIGFLDELFKANTAILNALLSLTNERLFYNMGQAFKVNLAFVVGASNETPADEELGALYDRFPIRVPCLAVSEKKLPTVIQMAHNHENIRIDRQACLNDVRLLTKVAMTHEDFGGISNAFPRNDDGSFESRFVQLLTSFRDEFRISDRTPYRILRLCRSLALIDGEKLGPMQLRAFGYVAPRVSSALDLQQLVTKRLQQWDDRCYNLFDSHS